MKKNLIALAVAGAMTAPMAALADMSVSGTLQSEIVSVTTDGTRADGIYMQDGSTMNTENGHNVGALTVAASEDLGGGLNGLARYAFNISTDGASGIGQREAYVGLNGGFGTALAGRMDTPYKNATAKWDPFIGTFMQARGNGGASAGATGHGSYLNNVLAYANKFGMATVVVGASFDETSDGAADPATNGNHAMTASVNVPVGPVEIALGYLDAYADGDDTAIKFGVKYSAGALSVYGQMEDRDVALGTNPDGSTYMLLGVNYKAGANTFGLNYGNNNDNAGDVDVTYLALGMNHAFSEKTRVHVGYKSTDVDGDKEDIIGAGLRVSF